MAEPDQIFSPPNFPPKVAAALLKAQRSLRSVAKGSENKFHNYKYAGAEDVLTEAREHLHEAGLIVIRDTVSIDESRSSATSIFLIAHEDGDAVYASQEFPIVPGNGRPMDKAHAATLTTSMSYFLRDLLLIPRVDGNEVDTRDDTAYKHQPTKRVSKKTAKPSKKTAADLADEIVKVATDEQMEKMLNHLGERGCSMLVELPIEELENWLTRLKEANK